MISEMRLISSCEYNMDNCCVELKYSDGSEIYINTLAIEESLDANMIQRAALDYLIYNAPQEYADLVLHGGLEKFVKCASMRDYGLQG